MDDFSNLLQCSTSDTVHAAQLSSSEGRYTSRSLGEKKKIHKSQQTLPVC